MNGKLIITVLFVFFVAASAHADSLRCGDRVVSTGATKTDVIAKCGSPADKQSRQEEIVDKTDPDLKRIMTITVEEWTYNFGPDSLIRVLTFKNGILTDVEEGGYGY